MSQMADETTTPPSLPDASHVAERTTTTGVDTMPVLPDAPTLPEGVRAPAESSRPPSLSLDGELPRLGETSTPPLPPESTSPTTSAPTAAAPLTDTPLTDTPLELPTLPTLPTAAPVITGPLGMPAPDAHRTAPNGDATSDDGDDADRAPVDEHPMAHLMPQKTAPSEASQRAADIRAAKKAKAKKIKIGVAIGSLVFLAVVGPPLGRWLADAVNEAGNTSTEEPAP